MKKVGIIGMGNMGNHLAKLICRNHLDHALSVSHSEYENSTIIMSSDVIFLTVKPKDIENVCYQIRDTLNKDSDNYLNRERNIISAAAGVTCEQIKHFLYKDAEYTNNINVSRCMPNIPISVGKGSIIWYHHDNLEEENKRFLLRLAAGINNRWVAKEDMLDPGTIISGCSPAFIAKFLEHYIDIGIELGFSHEEAKSLLVKSFEGTLKMLDNKECSDIIGEVASKEGATEKALEVLDQNNLYDILKDSVNTSYDRIRDIKNSVRCERD